MVCRFLAEGSGWGKKSGEKGFDVFPFPLLFILLLCLSAFPRCRKLDSSRRPIRKAGNLRQGCRYVPGLRFGRRLGQARSLRGTGSSCSNRVLFLDSIHPAFRRIVLRRRLTRSGLGLCGRLPIQSHTQRLHLRRAA